MKKKQLSCRGKRIPGSGNSSGEGFEGEWPSESQNSGEAGLTGRENKSEMGETGPP